MDFYFAGTINYWNYWNYWKVDSVVIFPGESIQGQYILCTEKGWNDKVISPRIISNKSDNKIKIVQNYEEIGDDFRVENITDKPVKVIFNVASNFDLEIGVPDSEGIFDNAGIFLENGDVHGGVLSYDKENNYYYYDFENVPGINYMHFRVEEYFDYSSVPCWTQSSYEESEVSFDKTGKNLNWKQAIYYTEKDYESLCIRDLPYVSHKFRILIRIDDEATKQVSVACIPLEAIPEEDYTPKTMSLKVQGMSDIKMSTGSTYSKTFRKSNFNNKDSITINSVVFDGVNYGPSQDTFLTNKQEIQLIKGGTGNIIFNFDLEKYGVTDYRLYINPFVNPMTARISVYSSNLLYIAGSVNDWTFDMLNYTSRLEDIIGNYDNDNDVPVAFREAWYLYKQYEIRDFWFYEFTSDYNGNDVQFKVTDEEDFWEYFQLFKDAVVSTESFVVSGSQNVNPDGNAVVGSQISKGDKLCFYRKNGRNGTYYAILLKAKIE